uniref:Uncharacterized protein n=1 Tax=Arundo donax TaxID=35708 RepID=A0A0A9A1A0_ARUDO
MNNKWTTAYRSTTCPFSAKL